MKVKPENRIQSLARLFLDPINIDKNDVQNAYLALVLIIGLIVINIIIGIYIVSTKSRDKDKINSGYYTLLLPGKIIIYFYNWLIIVPFAQSLMVVFLQSSETSFQAQIFSALRMTLLFISFIVMMLQMVYIEIFIQSPKFNTEDFLYQRNGFFKYGYSIIRILIVIITYVFNSESKTQQNLKTILTSYLLLLLLINHYYHLPFKNKKI